MKTATKRRTGTLPVSIFFPSGQAFQAIPTHSRRRNLGSLSKPGFGRQCFTLHPCAPNSHSALERRTICSRSHFVHLFQFVLIRVIRVKPFSQKQKITKRTHLVMLNYSITTMTYPHLVLNRHKKRTHFLRPKSFFSFPSIPFPPRSTVRP